MATSARLEELQQKFRENPRRYFAPLANEHRKLGDLEQAIALCRTHLPQQPQHVSGHIVLAQALFEAGEVSDARGAFELALDLDPENLIALRFLGDIARAQGEHLTARQWYERVLDADPRNDEIAQLVRNIEQGGAMPAAAPVSADAAAAEQASEAPLPVASDPNEENAESAAAAPVMPQPIEDLATAWQHEVAALDVAAPFPSYEPDDADASPSMATDAPVLEREPEPQVEPEPEPEPAAAAEFAAALSVLETAEETTGDADPAEEPNELWLEPDEEFVATMPAGEPAEASAPPPFVDIDYSMFEAVADEEEIAAAIPEAPVGAEPDAPPLAEPRTSSDDWFATSNPADADSVSADAASDAAFDLDAAFQSVLPNADEFSGEPGSDTDATRVEPPAFADATAESGTGEWPLAEGEPAAPDDAAFSTSLGSADSVDDAFAELDRMTASMESDVTASAMLLPDEQYAAADAAPQRADAVIGRTPDEGMPAVEAAANAFVTETMAELYLQQGFREDALSVYRQLLALSPEDSVLVARVRALEGGAPPAGAAADDASDLDAFRLAPPARADAAGQSVRAFLGVFARRRAPMRRRDSITANRPPQADSALSTLFGTPQHGDETSAAVLAAAFAAPNADSETLPGRPTRAAAQELSLGDVFGDGEGGGAARAATFDEFFSTGSADNAAQSPLDEEGSDMVQFTAWLEGLKKK